MMVDLILWNGFDLIYCVDLFIYFPINKRRSIDNFLGGFDFLDGWLGYVNSPLLGFLCKFVGL